MHGERVGGDNNTSKYSNYAIVLLKCMCGETSKDYVLLNIHDYATNRISFSFLHLALLLAIVDWLTCTAGKTKRMRVAYTGPTAEHEASF